MKRGIVLITVAAAALWWGLRVVSSSRQLLSPADFSAGGPDALEFCDPRNPRFLPIVDRRSAVVLTARTPDRIHLATAAGRPIGPSDLEGGSLRIFAVDDQVRNFVSGAAQPADGAMAIGRERNASAGDWTFSFGHASRIFADFTPRATGQEMYASARAPEDLRSGAIMTEDSSIALSTRPERVFARQPVEVLAQASGAIQQAQLAVFDLRPGGPTGMFISSPERVDDRLLRFRLTFPDAGKYVLWVQAGVGNAARFRRFETTVAP
jgi:hypothetical protein